MSRAFRLASVLVSFAVFASCQSSSPVDSSNAPVDVTVPMKADSIHPLDSLQPFHTPTDSGLAVRGALAKADVYNVAIHLSRPLNGGVLKFHYTSFGLRIFTASFTQEDRKPDLKLTGFDTTASEKLALKLLTDFDSARTRSPSTHSRRTDPVSVQIQDLRAFYVGLLLAGDSAYAGFPATIPAGMDTVGLRGEVLVAAVGTGKTLTQLVTTWSLDLDSTKARIAIVALVVKGIIKDTSMVFPPSTVRLKQEISVSPDPVVAGTRAKLAGAFSWNPGPLPSIVSTVLREGAATSKVRVLSSVSLAQSDTTLSMADGYLVEVDPSADTGAYVLSIQLTNGGDVVRSEARFRVVAPDQRVDATPPSLSIQSPSKDTTVPNATSSIVVVAIATDSAGIDSVEIGGHKLTATPYSASVDLAVGTDTIVVQAWDKSGLRSTKTVVVMRAKSSGDTTKPVIKRVGVSNDTTVENSTVSLLLSWVVTDDSALAKVTLNDSILASASGLYSKTMKLSVGKNPFVLAAMDVRGNPKFDTLVVTRLALVDTTRPVLSIVSPSKDTSVPNGTASMQVVVSASDASGIDSVKIGSQKLTATPYTASVDLAVGSDTIVVQVWDKAGLRSTKSVVVTRAAIPSKLTWTGLKDVVIAEDTAITVSFGLTGIKGDSVWVQFTPEDSSLVQIHSLSKASGAGATQVSFQVAPRADANGRVNIKLVAKDASDSAMGTFQLQVAPRNDPSVFTVTKIVPPINGTALMTVSGWATGISAGPKDEAAQKTTFEVVAADQADILVGIPSIDSAGTLRVQAKPGVSGSAKFRARLVDNGDSSGTNQNKGQWQDFVVTVNAAPTLTLPVRSFSLWQNSVLSFGAIALQDDETSAGNLTLKRTSSNNSLLPPDSVYLSGTGASRKVTLHPVSDRTGSCTLYFQVADSMGGSKSDSILVVVKGINQAPSFTLSSTSIQLQNYNRDSLLVRIVSAETTNDTAQYILERRIDLIGSPLDSVLSSKPTLDAQGTLHLPRLPNPRGWFTFRITIKDNGGTENGGIDSATKDLKIFFSDTIIDGGDKNVYHYLVLGKLSWFRENLRRQPKWGPLYSDSNGVMYEWAQAFDADSVNCRYSGDCALEKSGANLQGLCPAGWNIPADMQWESLVKWAAQGGADSSGATRLRSRIGWNWFQYMGAIFNAPGTDDWGFGVRPNYYYGNAGDPMTGGSGRYWASAFANTPDPTSSTYGRFFADFSVTGSERNGYWNTFTVWGMDAQRYFQTYSVRCVRNAPPGQW